MKRKKVVRVCIPHETQSIITGSDQWGGLIEHLRYARLITVHRDNDEGICFDILPPHGVNNEIWAEQNAERMQSFGVNAVSAPESNNG
jgi:hypothetical protein